MKISKYRLLVLIILMAAASAVVALQAKRKSFSLSETVGAPPATQKSRDGIAAQEYEVYAVLIKANGRADEADRVLVIEEQPSPWISSVDEGQSNFYEDM